MYKIMLQLCYKSKLAKIKGFLFMVLPCSFGISCLCVQVFILSVLQTKLNDRPVALFRDGNRVFTSRTDCCIKSLRWLQSWLLKFSFSSINHHMDQIISNTAVRYTPTLWALLDLQVIRKAVLTVNTEAGRLTLQLIRYSEMERGVRDEDVP